MIRRLKKPIAILTLLLIITQIFSPTISYALTAGPTSPEATSFEPVDTTDMVNPLTGDFTYNMPLMEIPGPEGGYPLSLAYHAGIQPNEEAAWVGLGWTLNPGAINRSVNGYPDDFKDVNQTVRSYWSGGSTKTVGVDVGFGLGPASVNFGLEFSQDTYKGFGIGASIGVGAQIKGSPFNIGVSVGVSPYGEMYAGLNIGVSTGKSGEEGLRLGIGVGVSTNFESLNAGANAGISYSDGGKYSASLLGASIGSGGGKGKMSVGGMSASVNNANAGKMQTESSGWSFTLPLPIISVGISSNYTRYWSDETANVLTNGALYAPVSPGDLNNNAYDTYRLLNPNRANIVDNPDPDRLIGGSYPDFDTYNVTAQGLSGNMRPYAYQAVVYKQNIVNNNDHNYDVTARIISSNKVNASNYAFRFANDFSNGYRQNPSNPGMDAFSFADAIYGNNDGNFGYDPSQNKLAGSKDIQYFTYAQVSSGYAKSKGLIGAKPISQDTRIQAFMITNASGVTYHYTLPAYSGNEEVYTEKIDQSGGLKFNKLSKPKSYAYTWLLTAVTGPDYVDRNDDGEPNESDWGYYVNFEYGLWSDSYAWRNPSEGFHKDIDAEFKSRSTGTKQVYYLNTIKTRSHVAIFQKSVRADAKSIKDYNAGNQNSANNPYTASSLKLDKIYLVKMEDYKNLFLQSNGFNSPINLWNNTPEKRSPNNDLLEDKNAVIDDQDIVSNYGAIKEATIRAINFNYDYSLCNGTYNSYFPNPSEPNQNNIPKVGKLTLLSVENTGKKDSKILPPTEFEYDLDPNLDENKDKIQIYDSGNVKQILASNPNKFEVGDLITFTWGITVCYCVLTSKSSNVFGVKYLTGAPGAGGNSAGLLDAVKTKNPPYNKDAVDIWGMYKSDYSGSTGNENLDKMPTAVSNVATDAWCLRKIKSQLGADINITYEGDDYTRSVLNKSRALVLTDFDNSSQRNEHNVICTINYPNGNVSDFLKEGDKVNLILLKKEYRIMQDNTGRMDANYSVVNSANYGDQIIRSINGNKVTIHYTDAFYNEIVRKTSSNVYYDFPTIRVGNIGVSNRVDKYYGGGIRVKQIEVNSLDGYLKRTKYSYNTPSFNNQANNLSSGTTAYEPYLFDIDNVRNYIVNNPFPDNPYLYLQDSPEKIAEAVKSYRRELYKDMSYLLSISRELPPPGIMYEYVTVKDEEIAPDGTISIGAGKSTYQYEVFNSGMIGKKEYNYQEGSNTRLINMSIKDYTSRLGNLKRMITYDNLGNKLTEVINHYLHDPIADKSFSEQASSYDAMMFPYNYQGLIQERYGDSRTIMENGTPIYKTIMSGHDFYPAIQTGTTQIDYKNGTKVHQENLAFDYYNGMVSKTVTTDSYGNKFVNETVPAYRVYPSMGLKVNESANGLHKNMLVQQASTKITKVDYNNQPLALLSASVQTWGNDLQVLDPNGDATAYKQENIWRKKATYNWLPEGSSINGLSNISTFQDYFSGGVNNPSWKKTSEIKLYNIYSAALEGTDINNKYSATKMGYSNSKVILSGNAARYHEIAFSGAEDQYVKNGNIEFGTGIMAGNGVVSTAMAHTGSKSLSLSQGGKGFIYTVAVNKLDPNKRNYIGSVWVKPSNGDINGARLFYQNDNGAEVLINPVFQKQAAGWYLLNMNIPASAIGSGTLTVGIKNIGETAIYADDFRFQPLDAVTTAYVYDAKNGELNYTLDNNNLFIKYEYDNAGRLIKTYKEVLGKVNTPLIKEYGYNYGKKIAGTIAYAKIETSYVTVGDSYNLVYKARFYADAACTIPASLDRTIQLKYVYIESIFTMTGFQQNETNLSKTAPEGATYIDLGEYPYSKVSPDGSTVTQERLRISPGNNYNAVYF